MRALAAIREPCLAERVYVLMTRGVWADSQEFAMIAGMIASTLIKHEAKEILGVGKEDGQQRQATPLGEEINGLLDTFGLKEAVHTALDPMSLLPDHEPENKPETKPEHDHET